MNPFVIPAEAGIQSYVPDLRMQGLGPGLRRGDRGEVEGYGDLEFAKAGLWR